VTLGGGVGGRGCMAGRSAVGGVAPGPSRENRKGNEEEGAGFQTYLSLSVVYVTDKLRRNHAMSALVTLVRRLCHVTNEFTWYK
jgi:hypothetical protein